MSKNKYFCVCRESDVSKCILQGKESIKPDDFIDENGKDKAGAKVFDATQIERIKVGMTLTWDSDKFKVERKTLAYYYIQFYDNDEHVPEHDKIMLANESTYEMQKSVVEDKRHLTMLILGLFGKQNDHNFIEINSKATGMEPCKLVIDKLRRYSSQPDVFFGFRAAKTFETCEPVAVKLVPVAQTADAVSMFAGGQYNRKYLARAYSYPASEDVWIAMELCHTRTFDYWVTRPTSTVGYLIDHSQLKICFRHILYGLDHLHSQDIIHGNMNMQNILLSLPHRNRIKIGDYDHVKQNNDNNRNSICKTDDIKLTARIFFKCLCRDDKIDPKQVVEAIDDDTVKSWIDDIAREINKKESNEVDEIGLCEGDKAAVYKIMKIVHHKKPPPESKKSITPVWIELLQRLKEEIRDPNANEKPAMVLSEKDRFMSAYLIMHMVLDGPEAAEILQHPFFWSECKILDFIARMEGIFYKLSKNETISNPKGSAVLESIKKAFERATAATWPELNWINSIETTLKSNKYCDESTAKKLLNDASDKSSIKFGLSDLQSFIHDVSKSDWWPKRMDTKDIAEQFLTRLVTESITSGGDQCDDYEKSDVCKFVSSGLLTQLDNVKTIQSHAENYWKKKHNKEVLNKVKNNKFPISDLKKIVPYLSNDFDNPVFKKELEQVPSFGKNLEDAAEKFWENIAREKIQEKNEYNSNIVKFMRFIRNTYGHYHESSDESKKSAENSDAKKNGLQGCFDSPTALWNCLGNILPEMICLLHRAVWLELHNPDLLPDLCQFLLEPNNTLRL